MKAFIRALIIGAMLLVLLAIGGLIAAHLYLDAKKVESLIANSLLEETGRNATIGGEVETNFSLMPSVTLRQVAFDNAQWAEKEPFFKAEALTVEFALLPLINGELQISRLEATGAALHLAESGDKANWLFAASDKENETTEQTESQDAQDETTPQGEGDGEADADAEADNTTNNMAEGDGFTIDQLILKNSFITYRSDSMPRERLTINTLQATSIGEAGVEHFELEGELREMAIAATGNWAGEMLRLDISGEKPGVSLKSELALALDDYSYDGSVKVDSRTISELLAVFGIANDNQSALKADVNVGGTMKVVHLNRLNANYGGIQATGNGKVMLDRPTPFIEADLSFDQLDFRSDQASPAPASAGTNEPADSYYLPDTPLPVDILGSIDGNFRLAAKQIQLNQIVFFQPSLEASLQNQQLTIKEFSAQTNDGRIFGSAHMDARSKPAALDTTIKIRNVTLGKLLNELASDNSITGGRITSTLELAGRGDTLRQIFTGSDGRFDLLIEEAQYVSPEKGIQQASRFFDILRGGNKSGPVDLRCGIADFIIENGIAESSVIAVKSDAAIINGDGSVNLNDETLRIALNARSSVIGFADVIPPLVIAGRWHDPTVTLNAAQNLINIGKLAIGTATGVGLFAILGEQVTDKLGITAENNPCLQAIDEANKKAAQADANPEAALDTAKDNIRGIGREIKGNINESLKSTEDQAKALRDEVESIKNRFKR